MQKRKETKNKFIGLLLALCLGLINSGRGSGVKNMKFVQLIALGICAFIITSDILLSIIFLLPVAFLFASGTGELMPLFKTKSSNQWRLYEFLMIFIYAILFFYTPYKYISAGIFCLMPVYVIYKKIKSK